MTPCVSHPDTSHPLQSRYKAKIKLSAPVIKGAGSFLRFLPGERYRQSRATLRSQSSVSMHEIPSAGWLPVK